MAQYDPITGHTTSPAANALEDDDTVTRYAVTCDGVTFEIFAYDADQAERRARALYYRQNVKQARVVKVDYKGTRK